MRKDVRITDSPVLSNLKPPVAFLDATICLSLQILNVPLLSHRTRDIDVFR